MEYVIVENGFIVKHLCGNRLPEGAITVPDGFPGYVGIPFAAILPDFSGIKPLSQQVKEGILKIPEGMKIDSSDTELVRMDQDELDKIYPIQIWAIPGDTHPIQVHKSFDEFGVLGYPIPKNAVLVREEYPGDGYKAKEDGTWENADIA